MWHHQYPHSLTLSSCRHPEWGRCRAYVSSEDPLLSGSMMEVVLEEGLHVQHWALSMLQASFAEALQR